MKGINSKNRFSARSVLAMLLAATVVQCAMAIVGNKTKLIEDAIAAGKAAKEKYLNILMTADRKRSFGGCPFRSLNGCPFRETRESNTVVLDAEEALGMTLHMLSACGDATLEDLQNDPEIIEAWKTHFKCEAHKPECSPDMKYRTIDGTCNNPNNPSWGKADSLHRQLMKPAYDDNYSKPRIKSSKNGETLPAARSISIACFRDGTNVIDQARTVLSFVMLQLLDHEMTETAGIGEDNGFDCCNLNDPEHDQCYNIIVSDDDPIFGTAGQKKPCFGFPRAHIGFDRCKPDLRKHFNRATSYIDGSAIYGSTHERLDLLRSKTVKGALKVKLIAGQEFGPDGETNCNISVIEKIEKVTCPLNGDVRANEHPLLSIIHQLFIREHNKIAKQLEIINPHWSSDTIFYETRKIISAFIQCIIYSEVIPVTLSSSAINEHDLLGIHLKYDENIDATTSSSFVGAAHRFGHSAVIERFRALDTNYEQTMNLDLHLTFFKPAFLQHSTGISPDEFLRAAITDNAMKVDGQFSSSILDKLFPTKEGKTEDLAALNIQRARDMGIAPYVKWRKFCKLSEVKTFNDLASHFTNADIEKLKIAYRNVEDIDLFVAGIMEKHVDGSSLGPTFECLIGKQYHNLRFGDKFFYTNEGQFESDQLKEIKKVSLAMLICRNFQTIEKVQTNPLCVHDSATNPYIYCKDLTSGIDLEQWRENEP